MIRVDGNSGSASLIKVRGLNKTYSRGGEKIQVLQGLNLDVDKGDFVAFMGPSGSGKTTLLNLLGGLDVPSAGSITVDGDEITHMSGSKLTQWRARHVGFIFHLYNLIPVLTSSLLAPTPRCISKNACSSRARLLVRASWPEVRYEIQPLDPGQSVPQEDSPYPYCRLFCGRSGSLHVSCRGEERLQPRHGNRGRGPPHRRQSHWSNAIIADLRPRQNPCHSRGQSRHPQSLVRRCLSR